MGKTGEPKADTPAPRVKPRRPLRLKWHGRKDRLLQHDGKRHWLRAGQPHLIEADTWDAMKAGPLAATIADLLASGEIEEVR